MKEQKQYSIGYVDGYGDFMKVWDNKGRTAKYTFEEAKAKAQEMKANRDIVRIYKGWEVIEVVK